MFQYLEHSSFNLHVHNDKKSKMSNFKILKRYAALLYLNCSSVLTVPINTFCLAEVFFSFFLEQN